VLAGLPFIRLLDVNQADGNVPLWAEALVADRDHVIDLLEKHDIQARPFLPNLSLSPHLGNWNDDDFPNSQYFAKHGLFLPSGPDMPIEHVERVALVLRGIEPLLKNDL
jgi:dTDP-4-amino-4,6-dideoxygalactose transaminase